MRLQNLATGLLLSAFTLAMGSRAQAQVQPDASSLPTDKNKSEQVKDTDIRYASALHLAYISTTNAALNESAETGLNNLAAEMIKYTSVEPEGVVAIDIENDDISFFPFIYWAVTDDVMPLTKAAQEKVQTYLNTGGVIMFDIMDDNAAYNNNNSLQRLLGDIKIRPLKQIDTDHTLSKSFYLISGLPGSKDYGATWLETPSTEQSESVSSVVIGDNNWSSAWAGQSITKDTPQWKMAIKAGINTVMYALTGNYKGDKIHIPGIEEKRKLNIPRP